MKRLSPYEMCVKRLKCLVRRQIRVDVQVVYKITNAIEKMQLVWVSHFPSLIIKQQKARSMEPKDNKFKRDKRVSFYAMSN